MSGRAAGERDTYSAWLPWGVFVLYVVTGWLGLRVASIAGAVTLFWVPSGLSIAAVALLGPRVGVAVFAGSLTLNLVTTRDPVFGAVVATGNLLEAWLAVHVFSRWANGRLDLGRPRDAGAFVLASAIGCAASASIGAAVVHLRLSPHETWYPLTAAIWWLGDMAGALVVAPFLLALARPVGGTGAVGPGPLDALVALLVASGVAVFQLRLPEPELGYPLTIVPLAAITSAALRYGTRGGTSAAAATCISAVLGTLADRGPYATGDAMHELSLAWAGIAIAAGTSLVVSALSSERFEAELRVATSEARLRGIFDHAPEGLMLLDARRRIVLANPWIVAFLGTREDALLGMDAFAMVDDGTRERIRTETVRGLGSTTRVREVRVDHERARGDVRCLLVRVTLLGAGARFEGAVVVVEDVTARERDAEERAMMETQLAAAQRFDSIGNLAGGIAHDFNNMLQAITANLELAQLAGQKGRDPVVQVKRALDAAERASALTRQLLAFSRRQPASFDHVDLVALLRTSMAMLERLLPEDIHLVFDPHCPEAPVRGDHAQLEQVVMNLVVNARDAMPTGGELRIEVDTQLFEHADGGLVRLVVTDQGPGVPSDIRDRIFEPFFTTKAVGRGTGLGLAVVYGIVRSHGGSVHVENVTPHGARFVVELPWLERPSYLAVDVEDGEPPLGDGETILLVEDDAMVRSAVRDMLDAAGYRVAVASNGADAVAVFEDAGEAFDLVLLDVVMPIMGGREAYERLRRLRSDVRVIFATGYSEEQIDVGFVLREEVPVLTKPYDRQQLLRTVANVLRRGRNAQDADSPRGRDDGTDA